MAVVVNPGVVIPRGRERGGREGGVVREKVRIKGGGREGGRGGE